jgi:hypothetical protein
MPKHSQGIYHRSAQISKATTPTALKLKKNGRAISGPAVHLACVWPSARFHFLSDSCGNGKNGANKQYHYQIGYGISQVEINDVSLDRQHQQERNHDSKGDASQYFPHFYLPSL